MIAVRLGRPLLVLLGMLIVVPACSGQRAPTTGQEQVVHFNPEPSTGPFVVVAVDNHFHDIHPVDRTRIAGGRPFVIKNEGRNLHNFTVVGTKISFDIKPGEVVTWPRLGDRLKPGFYQVVCNYHSYQGMVGSFVVTP